MDSDAIGYHLMSLGTVLLHDSNFYSHYPQTQITKKFASDYEANGFLLPSPDLDVYIYIYF